MTEFTFVGKLSNGETLEFGFFIKGDTEKFVNSFKEAGFNGSTFLLEEAFDLNLNEYHVKINFEKVDHWTLRKELHDNEH